MNIVQRSKFVLLSYLEAIFSLKNTLRLFYGWLIFFAGQSSLSIAGISGPFPTCCYDGTESTVSCSTSVVSSSAFGYFCGNAIAQSHARLNDAQLMAEGACSRVGGTMDWGSGECHPAAGECTWWVIAFQPYSHWDVISGTCDCPQHKIWRE